MRTGRKSLRIFVSVALVGVVGLTTIMVLTSSPRADAPPYGRCQDVNTVTGTDRDDTLEGTPCRDVLIGLEGDDILVGGDDDDRLLGGPGDDVLRGGPG
ncbi:MAG: hypothetical protein ACRDJF_12455, partial [Actinomycetota bacterium]